MHRCFLPEAAHHTNRIGEINHPEHRRDDSSNAITMRLHRGVNPQSLPHTVGATVHNGFLFHSSPCREPTAGNINIVLHLPVNAVSSATLASSSFFSQVLSSPSRVGVDISHAWGRSVDVGVLSWRNAPRLSHFNTVAWLHWCHCTCSLTVL